MQIASTLIAVLGFGGYTWPRERVHPCRFCQLSSGGDVPFFEHKAPLAHTESGSTDSTIGCTCAAPGTLNPHPRRPKQPVSMLAVVVAAAGAI